MGSFTEGVCGCVLASVRESCIVSFRDTKSRSSEVWACVGRPGRTAAANFQCKCKQSVGTAAPCNLAQQVICGPIFLHRKAFQGLLFLGRPGSSCWWRDVVTLQWTDPARRMPGIL